MKTFFQIYTMYIYNNNDESWHSVMGVIVSTCVMQTNKKSYLQITSKNSINTFLIFLHKCSRSYGHYKTAEYCQM